MNLTSDYLKILRVGVMAATFQRIVIS